MKDGQKFFLLVAAFLLAYFVPWDHVAIRRSGLEAFLMLQDYARNHVLTCLVPAFFIAGAINVFVSQASILKYFGAEANRLLSYSVASVSGTILSACSCTVLPLFAGIYMRGAGLGPATAFLFSGPAINILAITLTAKVLGLKLGLARAVSAVAFSVITGFFMSIIFRQEEEERMKGPVFLPESDGMPRTLLQEGLYFGVLVLILILASLAKPADGGGHVWLALYAWKWPLVIILGFLLLLMLKFWFSREELELWIKSTWGFMVQIFPLLLAGVLVAGFFLGRPGYGALIPQEVVASLVGGNSLGANFLAAIVGALMYFATLTEVPILQGLLGAGMGQGPALALLLAGPSISLPSMIGLSAIIGWKKTLTYVAIVVFLATITGFLYGFLAT
ncbi:MAG TPA: permease [Syntrophales bacterium]|nr:permease [Syntrophales bacterium]HOL58304.1 permease [Syntrophales bacterium]HPO34473.1 permease [Syntrophales bacterium]